MPRRAPCFYGECEGCRKRAYMRRWYSTKTPEERRAMTLARDQDKVRAADRARYRRDRAKRYELAAAYMVRHPEKRKAHTAVSNAIRDGRLARRPCGVCGNARSHAHHEDYSAPLDVMWLCQEHHTARHREIGTFSRREFE